MSKFNILEFNKNMKIHLKGAVEKAEQKSAQAKQRLREARQLETEVLKRLEEKQNRASAKEDIDETKGIVEEKPTVSIASEPPEVQEKPAAEIAQQQVKVSEQSQPQQVSTNKVKEELEGQPEKQIKEEKENMKKAVGENTEKKAVTTQKKQSEQP